MANRPRAKDLIEDNSLGMQVNYYMLLSEKQFENIDNPLLYRQPDDLDRDIESFYTTHHLENHVDLELLKRGARLARDPEMFAVTGDLTDFEKRALKKEENPKFREQTKELQVILMTCCIGAIVQGWAQSNIIGANLLWPEEFKIQSYLNPFDTEANPLWKDVWIFGAVNGVTYFAASLIGAWLSDPLNEYFTGRRGALFVSGIFSLGAAIGSAYAQNWEQLFVCRLLQGVGMGAKASIVPIFESEIAPARIRGNFMLCFMRFHLATGLFLGGAANLIVHKHWRLQVASGFIPAVPLLCLVFVCSESPRWLIKKGKYAEAYRVLRRLRESHLQAARDLYYIHAQMQGLDHTVYQREVRKTTFFWRVVRLFTVPRTRRATVAASIAMLSQQLSGINIFAFLAASFFEDAGYDDIECLWFSFGFSAANAIFSPIAYWYIDSRGRRFLLLLSLILIIPLLLATGFSFEIEPVKSTAQTGCVSFFLILYTAAYSPGAGVVPFPYASEVFPLINREVGMSFSCSVTFFFAGLLALTIKPLIYTLKHARVLGLFAGLDAVAVILVWLFVPSTAKTTALEEMNYIFGVRTRRHVRYQVFKVLPWILFKYIPWSVRHYSPWIKDQGEKPEPLEELYRWEKRSREEEDGMSESLRSGHSQHSQHLEPQTSQETSEAGQAPFLLPNHHLFQTSYSDARHQSVSVNPRSVRPPPS
ncbi:hypothetical protein AJ79_03312 [Helicocarpus griseus UAMH5409]|uniref:Major facilitator superfamily (MFS) profile domain-containing protein n=1 Tax=Helicocarpus griseus UAMH5409 TaxID=1447875 RepID=A0A2B7XZI9_9EURO|nr:hypothetical protein AJ79_03312 [Helicocarpus griseus UAMH5409]